MFSSENFQIFLLEMMLKPWNLITHWSFGLLRLGWRSTMATSGTAVGMVAGMLQYVPAVSLCAAKQKLDGIFWSNSSHLFCICQQYNFYLCVMYMPIMVCLQWGYEEAQWRDRMENSCVEMAVLTHTIFQLSSVFKFKECISIVFMSNFSKECFPCRKLLIKITKR